MNKFSSLSTSVLLALLTSSVTAAAYANGVENFSSRLTSSGSSETQKDNLSLNRNKKDSEEEVVSPFSKEDDLQGNKDEVALKGPSVFVPQEPTYDIYLDDAYWDTYHGKHEITGLKQALSQSASLNAHKAKSAESNVACVGTSCDSLDEALGSSLESSAHASDFYGNGSVFLANTESYDPLKTGRSSGAAKDSPKDHGPISALVSDDNKASSNLEANDTALEDKSVWDKVDKATSSLNTKEGSALNAASISDNADVKSNSFLQSKSTDLTNGKDPVAMVVTSHTLKLQNLVRDLGENANQGSVFEVPDSLELSVEHPKELSESFVVAGDSTVISYGTKEGNFAITVRIMPLNPDSPLLKSYNAFKDQMTERFSDKANMLYGEYQVESEYSCAADLIKAQQDLEEKELKAKESGHVLDPKAQSVFVPKLNVRPQELYMDLILRAYLKKGADGILPDMQSYFYERDIISHNYLTTISCEFRGSQAQVSLVKAQFDNFAPLCDRVVKSYNFTFKKQK